MDEIKVLFEIQNASAEKRRLEKQIKVLPQAKELKELKAEIEQSQAELYKIKSDIEGYKKSLSKEQLLINTLRDKANVLSDNLYSGELTNVKELENVKRNLETEQMKITNLEEKALVLMEKIDGSENKIKAMLKELEIKKKKFRDINKIYISRKDSITQSIQEIGNWLDAAVQGLRPGLLEDFEKLCNRFTDGRGVSLLKSGICSGCHMSVSFDLLKKAKNVNATIVCDNCGRWLIPQ